tara:strand:+ start:10099 stop:10512 length:414 start_codon:yes stop_codon:yes gene_type:complete
MKAVLVIFSVFCIFEDNLNLKKIFMPSTLGQVLKNQREIKDLSLRQVETLTKVSNAYLSQLENNKVKNPSVGILHKLSSFYNIEFDSLLVAAGLIKGEKAKEVKSASSFALSSDNLTDEEQEELIDYLKYIRQKKKK